MAARDDLGARRPGHARARRVVVRPHSADEVAAVLRLCNEARVPVTAAAGRSGVCGASVPVFGGVLLDLTAHRRASSTSTATSMLVDVLPGTFGDVFEDELRARARRHVRALAAVDGALDRRRLARVPRRRPALDPLRQDRGHRRPGSTSCSPTARWSRPAARPAPRSGPTSRSSSSARRARSASSSAPGSALHPLPPAEIRAAYAFTSFADGLDAMRRIVQRGATPAVLRLYDAIEADRSFQTGDAHVLLVLDEGDAHVVEATRRIVDEECAAARRARRRRSSSTGWSTATTCRRSKR